MNLTETHTTAKLWRKPTQSARAQHTEGPRGGRYLSSGYSRSAGAQGPSAAAGQGSGARRPGYGSGSSARRGTDTGARAARPARGASRGVHVRRPRSRRSNADGRGAGPGADGPAAHPDLPETALLLRACRRTARGSAPAASACLSVCSCLSLHPRVFCLSACLPDPLCPCLSLSTRLASCLSPVPLCLLGPVPWPRLQSNKRILAWKLELRFGRGRAEGHEAAF